MNKISYKSLPASELLSLGFRYWRKDMGMLLIPLSLFEEVLQSLEKGEVLLSINLIEHRVGIDEFDRDTRLGLTAYGWIAADFNTDANAPNVKS